MYLLSITRGVLAQSPEPEAYNKVFDSNRDRIGIWKCWFGGDGKTEEKPLGTRTRTNKQT